MAQHTLTPADEMRLEQERNIWLATVRPDGRPHLVPIWFVWVAGKFWLATGENSVKVRNLLANPNAALSLEDGSNVLICEGVAQISATPTREIVAAFAHKYAWVLNVEDGPLALIEVTPLRWLRW